MTPFKKCLDALTGRATLEQMLAQAEQQVIPGERRISRQLETIAKLERLGHNNSKAEEVLAVFLMTQALHVRDRDQLMVKPRRFSPLGRLSISLRRIHQFAQLLGQDASRNLFEGKPLCL